MITGIVIASLFCVGLAVSSEEGMVLHFLKKPFLNLDYKIEVANTFKFKTRVKFLKFLQWISKPLIMCVTCYGSIWGGSVYIALNGFDSITNLVIHIFAVAYLNTILYLLYNKL